MSAGYSEWHVWENSDLLRESEYISVVCELRGGRGLMVVPSRPTIACGCGCGR
jgi:hypothetical protein